MKCSKCDYEISEKAPKFCPNCGDSTIKAKQEVTWQNVCPACGIILATRPDDRCPNCNHSFASDVIGDTRLPQNGAVISLGLLFIAIVLTLAFALIIQVTAEDGSFARDIFLPGNALNTIPFTLNFLFFWSALILLYRIYLLRNEKVWLKISSQVSDDISKNGISALKKWLDNYRSSQAIVTIRLRRIYDHWQHSENTETLKDSIRYQYEIDRDLLESAYTLPRVFIWTMPMIGFIGTVVGISMAISNFSSFLGGEVTDTKVIVQQLGNVTSGLSFAFYTTLHGLGAAVLTMLPTTIIQKSEEDFLIEVNQHISEDIISKIHYASKKK